MGGIVGVFCWGGIIWLFVGVGIGGLVCMLFWFVFLSVVFEGLACEIFVSFV